jgi:hypothetical protein
VGRDYMTTGRDDRTDLTTRARVDELASSWETSVAALIRWNRRITYLALANTLIAVAAVAFCFAILRRTDGTARNNQAALCALRADVERRYQSGTAFLANHPKGIQGIPAATLRITLQGQARTIKSLAGLKCIAG